jgi:DUF4097 and DUF4098 domain-containing protein YvlB
MITAETRHDLFERRENRKGVFVKTSLFVLAFMALYAGTAYGGGLSEEDLVNVQEISLERVTGIEVAYRWEKIVIRQNDADTFVIKEYMNKNDPRYYARLSNAGNTVMVERGRRPFGFFINTFDVRAEVFVPQSYSGAITIKTASGGIEAPGAFICQKINIETASGHIRINRIAAGAVHLQASSGGIRAERVEGNLTVKTTNGSITVGSVEGDAAAESSSGDIRLEQITGSLRAKTASGGIRSGPAGGNAFAEAASGSIDLDTVSGNITAKTTSGSIRCRAGDNAEEISLESSSGGVTLELPRNFSANFSSRTSSGVLSAPFSETLFSQVSAPKTVRGITGGNNPVKNIAIKTTSGSIRVRWTD